MDMKQEILKRLDNAKQSFEANLAYGIKLWKSNSFYYMSKYEVIFEFFVDRVAGYRQKLRGFPLEEFDAKWQIVNEFLALPCPSNALPPRLIPKLRMAFENVVDERADSRTLLESYFIVTFDVKYKHFYKFDYLSYGGTLKLALDYYGKFLRGNFAMDQEEVTIKRIMDDIRIYVKSAGGDDKWQNAFTLALTNVCNVVLTLKANGLDRQEDLLNLMKEVYFVEGQSGKYNRVLDQSKKHLLMGYFDPKQLPIHVVALLIEGYLKAYRDVKLDVLLFLKYILLHVFVDPAKSVLSEIHQVFHLTQYVFHLLKKYFIKIDQKLVQDFDFNGIFTIKLKEFLEKYESSEENLRDIFSLICTINEYNPLMLETSIIDIILRTMFVKKGRETLEKFQAMLVSTINLFIKLNRSENFREELFMKLGDYLDEHDLAERLKELRKGSRKRKSMASVDEIPAKQRKTENGQEASLAVCTDDEFYLKLLYPADSDTTTNKVARLQLQDQWKTIAFAWPDHNGRLNQAMMDYVKGLLTKRSFVYWRKMQSYFLEILDALSEDQQSETELFKLEFATCWMCYFFAGNTLIEQTNLFWEKLGKRCEEFDKLLTSFGRMLSNETAPDRRLFESFLKLVYFYGNYRLVVHYYRPDSIDDSQHDRIHQFFSDEEWKALEDRIPASAVTLMNRIHLQKIRVLQLDNGAAEESEGQSELVEKILAPGSFDQLRWVLMDRSTSCWFMQLLSLDQKVTVVDRLLENRCYAEIEFAIDQLSDNHSLMEVVLLSCYKRIVETVLAECKSSVARKLSFEGIYEFDEEAVMKKIRKLLDKKADKKGERIALENINELKELLNILNLIRIDELAETQKIIIVAVGILVFTDVMDCGDSDVVTLYGNIINKQLTFGMVPNLLKFLNIDTLIRIFGQSSPVMVAFVRQTVTYLTTEAFDCLRTTLANFLEQSDERFELVLTIFFYLQKSNANRLKLIPVEQVSDLLAEYVDGIESFIGGKSAKKVRKSDAVLFDHLLKGCSLIVHYKATNKKELTDELREVLLQFVDQALKVDSLPSSTLLTNALQHKDFLKLDPERIDLVVENRWNSFLRQLRAECAMEDFNPADDPDVDAAHMQSKNVKIFASFLTHHQTAKKLAKRFELVEKEASVDRSYRSKQFVLRVYSTFAKNAFASGVKQEVEKVFVRSFGKVVADEVVPLCVLKKFFDDRSCLEEILSCFAAVVSNPKLTLVPSIMDNMLEFLSSINIKKYAVKDGEEKAFYQLHRLISDVLYLMMIIRPNYVAHRLPQYFYVFNGLIASVISYKEDRPLEKPLNSFEILTLSDLLLPLEKIMSHAAKKVAKDLRIMAPYVLAQVIHFIIQSKRPTTLHEKVAQTVYNVCYGLIEMYDKHSASYLLRTCDEASKNVYTEIVKGFRKYRSFKGKI